MRVAIINYGMGNLGSVRRALEELGVNVIIADHPMMLIDANRFILPGVGSFGAGMQRLRDGGWIDLLYQQVFEHHKPLLGICLGMQMLTGSSEENGKNDGLNFIPGKARRLDNLGCTLRIPHVGWNEVKFQKDSILFNKIPQAMDFYFVHSYAVEVNNPSDVSATTSYGINITAAISKSNIFGTQFHPEKSSKSGKQILKNFLEFVPC